MAEDPQPLTLQQRIAALNASHISRTPEDSPSIRPKPSIPLNRPALLPRQKTINNPPERTKAPGPKPAIGNLANGASAEVLPPPPVVQTGRDRSKAKPPPPPLPKRQSSQQSSEQCPALPPRRPTEQNTRKSSSESTLSMLSSVSGSSAALAKSRSRELSGSRIKAPGWGDTELPPLPSKQDGESNRKPSGEKPKHHNRVPLAPFRKPSTQGNTREETPEPPTPSLPPRLPARRQTDHFTDLPVQDAQPRQPLPIPSAGALDLAKESFTTSKREPPALPVGHPSNTVSNSELVSTKPQPPAIPLASRPKLSATSSTKTDSVLTMRTAHPVSSARNSSSSSSGCMVCRDFSAPDHHATLFPRQSVQSLQTLGHQLTSPFPSVTDKARAIFSWLHHNIMYDTISFFARNVQASTPQSTLQTGLAVCEGFAALFTTLATHAGLESVVISGHGKGFGFNSLPPGAPCPSYSSNHAWNAVRIDSGEWKLIDSCWGAGHVQGEGKPYIQRFEPQHFTMTNEEFGIKHFPGNRDMFFLPDGRRLAWEEYIRINPKYWPSTGSNAVEPPTIFSSARPDYGIGERTVCPRSRFLSPDAGGPIRFSFELQCPHWDLELHTKKGPPPVFILAIHGVDGKEKDYLPLEYVGGGSNNKNSSNLKKWGGDNWYVDVDARQLGSAGQTLTLFAVTSFGSQKDVRGLSVDEFRQGKGKVGMGFSGVAAWELV